MKPCEKVKVMKGGLALSDIIKRKILPKEEENGTETIHLMVDEYDTKSLCEGEASELTEIFTNQAQFRDSTIFIAAQPMEIYNLEYNILNGKKEMTSEIKPIFSELKKVMHVHSLKYVMRTTVEIYTLATITQNLLNDKQQSNEPFKENFKVLNICRYFLDSKIGHNICGPLPQLIKIPISADHFEQIALIAFFFSTVLKIDKKHIAIVHFHYNTPSWLNELLHLTIFQGLNITNEPGKFINLTRDQDNSKKNLVLVTNYRYIKGLEFSDVLLLLDEMTYYFQNYIPEAITRCTSNLSILNLPNDAKTFHGTCSSVLDEWEKINSKSPNSPILKAIDLQFCSNPICLAHVNDHCGDESIIYVHKGNKFYKGLYEDIQHRDIPKPSSDP